MAATTPAPSATDAISYDDLYARWERGNWRATEIDFTQDAIDWREKLTDEQRRSALWLYTLFFHGEDTVADTLSPYIAAAPLEEQKYFLATQQVDEARHAVFFNRFMHEVVGLGDGTIAGGLKATDDQITWGHRKVFTRLEQMAERAAQGPLQAEARRGGDAVPRGGRGPAGPARPAHDRALPGGVRPAAGLPQRHPQRRAGRAAPHRVRRQAARRALRRGPASASGRRSSTSCARCCRGRSRSPSRRTGTGATSSASGSRSWTSARRGCARWSRSCVPSASGSRTCTCPCASTSTRARRPSAA